MQKNANAFRRECPPISVKSGALMPEIPQAIKKPERETRLVYPKRKAARQEPGISTTALSIVEVYRLLLQVENIHISSLAESIQWINSRIASQHTHFMRIPAGPACRYS